MSKRKVPSVPGKLDPVLRNFLSAVREVINSGALGDTVINQTNITGGGGSATVTEEDLAALNPNLAALLSSATPTTPTGLTITGLFTNIFVNWNAASYTYHSFTEVWRANALDGSGALIPAASINFATDAKQVATSIGNIYVDNVEPGSKYYYWIRHVSVAGNKSAYNASLGTLGETTKDVNTVLTDKGWTIGVDNLYAASAWIGTADILDGHVTNAKIGNVIQSDNYNGSNLGWQLSKSGGNVNLNQLTVRDSAGNIFLQSSAGGIDWTKVINKPGFGSFAWLDGITAENIDTYIQDAAIGTAYIGDAAVSTLKIKNQAVTVPAYYEGTSITVVKGAGWTDIISINIGSDQAIHPLIIDFGYDSETKGSSILVSSQLVQFRVLNGDNQVLYLTSSSGVNQGVMPQKLLLSPIINGINFINPVKLQIAVSYVAGSGTIASNFTYSRPNSMTMTVKR